MLVSLLRGSDSLDHSGRAAAAYTTARLIVLTSKSILGATSRVLWCITGGGFAGAGGGTCQGHGMRTCQCRVCLGAVRPSGCLGKQGLWPKWQCELA